MTKIELNTMPSGHKQKYEMFFRKGESHCNNICCHKDCDDCEVNNRGLKDKIFDFYDVQDILFG